MGLSHFKLFAISLIFPGLTGAYYQKGLLRPVATTTPFLLAAHDLSSEHAQTGQTPPGAAKSSSLLPPHTSLCAEMLGIRNNAIVNANFTIHCSCDAGPRFIKKSSLAR